MSPPGSAPRRALVLLALSLAAPPVGAQTADVMFGGWSFRPREEGSRPAGLGGAYVAVADSVRTVTSNPAGLALVPQSEFVGGTGDLWAGIGHSFARPPATKTVALRPTEPGVPIPCAPKRPARPWAIALFAERSVAQAQTLSVVRAPGVIEESELRGNSERVGGAVAKGLTRWLQVGATVEWRHLRLQGQSTTRRSDDPLTQISLGGDTNKARAIVGALATFGRAFSPTAFRLGVSYRRDLWEWSVERTAIDVAGGTISEEPRLVQIAEPSVLSFGGAWRASDTWLLAVQADRIDYPAVQATLERNDGPQPLLRLRDGWEPRAGVEMSRPSPIGGYLKLRAGVRSETSGRFLYEGADVGLRQAFRGGPRAFRAAVGGSILAEFYEKAFRFDVDMSQIVAEPRSTLSSADGRRLSLGLTVRM